MTVITIDPERLARLNDPAGRSGMTACTVSALMAFAFLYAFGFMACMVATVLGSLARDRDLCHRHAKPPRSGEHHSFFFRSPL